MSDNLEFVIDGADNFTDTFKRLFLSLNSLKTAAIAVTGAMAGIGIGMLSIIKHTAEAGDKLNKLSKQLGTTTEWLSQMQYAAKLTDVDVELFEKSMKKLTVTVGEVAKGTDEKASKAFRDLGINVFNASGTMKNAQELLPELADKLNSVTNSTDRASLAAQIFSIRGLDMLKMTAEGSEGLRKMAEEADYFGVTISQKAAANSEEFSDSLERLNYSFQGIKNKFSENVMPYVTGLIKLLTTFIAENREQIVAFMEKIFTAFIYVYEIGKRVFTAISNIIDKVFGSGESFKAFMDNAWEAFKGILMIGMHVLNVLGNSISVVLGGAFIALFEAVKAGFKAAFTGDDVWEAMKGAFTSTAVDTLVAFKQVWSELPTELSPVFKDIKSNLEGMIGEGLLDSVPDAVDKIRTMLKDLGTGEDKPKIIDAPTALNELQMINQAYGLWFEQFKTNVEMLQEMTTALWQQFTSGMGNAVAQAIVYGQSLSESFKKLGQQLAATIISSLVQIGIKRLAISILSQTLNIAEGASRMAVLSGETYAGAFAATAAIPFIGPALAPGVAAASLSAMLAGSALAAAAGQGVGSTMGIPAAHGGMTSVPSEQTYLLDKGERVLSPNQNADLNEFMSGGGSGMQVGAVHLHILENATDFDALMRMSKFEVRELLVNKFFPVMKQLRSEGVTA